MPVKIRKTQNNPRNRHEDTNFSFTTKQYMKDMASLFGTENVFVLSVDDKAEVLIGVTTVAKQSPLVMHVNYEVSLPDHDFVKATKHKLTPSGYAACKICATSSKVIPEISYSGPTYIAIRNGMHDSSTTYSDGCNFGYLLELEQFQSVAKVGNEAKPITMIFSDGRSDENPHFPKTLNASIKQFKKHKFDAILESTHAPGTSAYNQVEGRMAPLSKVLAGLILPYDSFGKRKRILGDWERF